jgi:hypothetical protein
VRSLLAVASLLLFNSAIASPPSPQEEELYAGLLNWAIRFSGYPAPAVAPKVEFVPQAFFNQNACGGRACRVWGWYPNTGHEIVYVHEAVRPLIADGSDPRSLVAASIIVHEFTHYLQAAKRGFAPYQCAEAISLEHEAYGVQQAYIVSYGSFVTVGVSMHRAGCEGSASENVVQ